MNELYLKIQEYLNMDTEIEFEEFRDFYEKVMHYLNHEQQEPDETEIWESVFVVESIMSNAQNRAKTAEKNAERKKYKKMSERMNLYAGHFTKKLNQLGYTQDDIEQRFDAMLDEGVKK
ncbi:hypothetical protein [Salibacterium halotolerans]|uniref:Uncharacterized protein n=1 Tax=Salibacterium halotolerans TaxID=1884432 RepID=A0A1I5NRC8_9BACI|nr:hypothetical protein [Salibacterium halotolerans]SFP24210.1 hypothetical protein SAMN05518683_103245 [Salibacterium halotolerans]